MTLRPHLALSPSDAPRPSERVSVIAEMMGCDVTVVRRLISSGELETHGIGKRGVRVFLDSVRAYQDRKLKPFPPRSSGLIHRAKRPSPASTASFRATMARLSAKGLA